MDSDIDSIDITKFHNNYDLLSIQEKEIIANQLLASLSTIGFAYIRGHSIEQSLIDNLFCISNQFFNYDQIVKDKAISKDKARRGYSTYGSENFAALIGERMENDCVEKFRIGPLISDNIDSLDEYYTCKEGRIQFFPNIWPENPIELRETLSAYYQEMEKLTLTLLHILEIGLKIPDGTLANNMSKHTSILGINYFKELNINNKTINELRNEYPTSRSSPYDILRIAEHTDVSMLTILAHPLHHNDGLEIYDKRSGSWKQILPRENCLIINIGDCLQYWSQNRLVSTLHRVTLKNTANDEVKNADKDVTNIHCLSRMAIAYFASPNYDCILNYPDSECIGEDVPTAMSYSEWRRQRIKTAMKSMRR